MVVGLKVPILGDTSNLEAALGKAGGGVKGFGDILGGIPIPAVAAAGAVVAAGAAIVSMTEAAAADRDEQNKLELAIKNAGAATETSTQQVNDAIAAGQDKAFSDSDVRAGLEALITTTGDVTEADRLLKISQDVARKSGVDLKTAADAVAKAHAGQDGALRKLIPGLAKGKTATDTIALASQKAAGSADLYAKSSKGMQEAGADAFSEIGESIGGIFLPILDEVLPALLPVVKQLAALVTAVLPVLIPLVKILAAALRIVATVLGIVVGWVIKLVAWLGNAIDKIGRFLDKINPLKGIKLPSLPFLNSTGAGGGAPSATTRSGGVAGGVTINVSGAIDPEATARQIRRILEGHAARTGQSAAI